MKLHGLEINSMTLSQLDSHIKEMKIRSCGSYFCTIDLLGLDLSLRNPDYKKALQESYCIFPDGAGLAIAARMNRVLMPQRTPGIEVFKKICMLAEKRKYRIFLYGSRRKVLESTKRRLRRFFKNIIICGSVDGYSLSEEKVVETIERCRPDILFVALGIPGQEIFLNRNTKHLKIAFSLGVGGSFDVFSRRLKRAPRFIQKLGLEWLFRLAQEPSRIRKIIHIPRFLIRELLITIAGKK